MAELYDIGEGGFTPSLSVAGEYNPGITEEIDRKIRNLPGVRQHCEEQARILKEGTGSDNFEVIVSSRARSRARVYVAPRNSEGIREELSQAVLLKAALALAISHGKEAGAE